MKNWEGILLAGATIFVLGSCATDSGSYYDRPNWQVSSGAMEVDSERYRSQVDELTKELMKNGDYESEAAARAEAEARIRRETNEYFRRETRLTKEASFTWKPFAGR